MSFKESPDTDECWFQSPCEDYALSDLVDAMTLAKQQAL